MQTLETGGKWPGGRIPSAQATIETAGRLGNLDKTLENLENARLTVV